MRKTLTKIGLIISCAVLCGVLTITAVSALTSANVSKNYNPDSAGISNVKTVDAIEDYINSVNNKNTQIEKANLEDVMTTVTFSKAMNVNDIETYVKTHDIKVVQLQARGYDKYGNRITFFSRTDKGYEETFRMLNELAESDGVEFVGAIGIYALADSSSIGSLKNDERTLLIDTSADQYYNNNVEIQGAKRNSSSSNNKDDEPSFINSIAWDAEDLGLVKYENVQ